MSGARWLQVLDGRRRQRAAYVRVPTDAPRELDFVGLPFSCRGETVKGMNHRIKRAAYLPRRRAVGARGSSVGGSAARRWRRRDLGRRGGVGPPADREAGERWRHVWCARQNRLPLFAVLRLDARAKRARGRSAVGCCVWAFGTVGRTRSSSLTGPHRSAWTARLGASGGPNSFAALLRRAGE